MAMAMAKIIWRVIKTKHLVNSISVQKQQISSSSSILFKRVVVSKDGKEENILSLLKYPIIENIGLPCFKKPEYLAIHGHSQGIVCLSDISGDIWLYNPATRAFRKLPPSILLMKMMPETPGAIFTETNAVGFAYVPKSNDFKVVRVVHFMKDGPDFRPYTVQLGVEVYDLSTDRWRGNNKISEPPFVAVRTPSFEICHNGIYYWCGSDEGSILSFDMTQELFRPISMPKGFMWCNKVRSLLVWNGSIVLFDYPMSGDDKSFDIWLMVMDGSVDWVKLMTIGPLSGIVRPLLFANSSDQQLIMEAKDGHVVSYNLLTKQIKDLPIKGEPDRIQCFHFQNTESMSNVSQAWKTLP